MIKLLKIVFKMKFLLSIFIFLLPFYLIAQIDNESKHQKVLQKNIKDSMYVFGKWSEDGGTESHLKYLGLVKTKKGKVYKIITSSWYWGLSHRATSRIYIYNEKNQYLGNYPVGYTTDLPDKLKNGKLIFYNLGNKHCDEKLVTVVCLKNGLPKQFFLNCKEKYGDIYSFN